MFSIAKNINATITPVCISHIDHTFGIPGNDIFNVCIGETTYVEDTQISLKTTEKFLKYKLKGFRRSRINVIVY